MGNKRERNRISSRVDEFPPEIVELLNERLSHVSNTYADIAAELTDMGYSISKSAVGRYARRSNKAAQRIREAQAQTQQLLQAMRENKDIEASELAVALLVDSLTQRLATAEEEFEDVPIDKVGRLLIAAQRSTVYKERYAKGRKDALDAVESMINARLRQEIHGDPALLAQLEKHVAEAVKQEAARDE